MSDEIIRRLVGGGVLSENVQCWHRAEQGPGRPGGRTYSVLYMPEGPVRIDVMDGWASEFRTMWLKAEEVRPIEEWKEHLLRTGQHSVVRSYCSICGLEKKRADFTCPEGCRPGRMPEW